MVSLLDNAAPGGLLADPRPAILAQLFDMSVKKRPTILPMFTQQNGRIGLTAPQLLVDAVNSAMLPFAAAQGYRATPTDASKMAMDTMLGGGLLGRAPSGSLAVNVFHGTPHKFAPEPGFPYGRPRLDKMGTGEGAQAYGPGFYTGEAQGVAQTYKAPEGFYTRITGQLDPKTETAFDLIEGGASTSDVMGLMLSKYGGDISYDEVIKAIDGARDVGAGQGTLYKLDIPDADAAKMLDWDKPLSQQSKSVQDGLKKAAPTLDIEGRDSVMTGGVFLEKFGGLQDNMRENVARQLSDVGIPGVKYLDQGSRGAGEGSRNYAIWDQDVLDRTKMLERDGVTLGANKSPTAATAGLLSRLPMDEQSRMARAEGLGFDFDGFHGTGGKDISEMSGMTWMSESPRLANEYAAMRAISSDGMASQIMPLKARTGNVFNADFLPKSVTVNQMMNEVLDQAENNLGRTFSDGEMNKARELLETIRKAAVREESGPNYARHDFWNDSESIFGKDGAEAIKEIFKLSGFDSVRMREGGENTIGIFSPSNIRSRFAAFDPENAESANILAANAAPLGLLSVSEY